MHFGMMVFCFIKLLSTEKARAFCYINSREGRCTTQSSTPVTISQCCCSAVAVERSLSWGPGCDPCPPQGTAMFERLCSRGPGRDSFGLSKLIYQLNYMIVFPIDSHCNMFHYLFTTVLTCNIHS